MAIDNDIQNTLTSRLSIMPNVPKIALENVKFDPTKSEEYVRPTLIQAKCIWSTIDGKFEYTGIYQIDLFMKLNEGTAPALLLAGEIKDWFVSARDLQGEIGIVMIEEVSVSQARVVDGWWSCFVEINYRCVN
jgi:hypothetical protein